MARHKELTEMQKKFAHELVANEGRKTKYECVIYAGYAKDRAEESRKKGAWSAAINAEVARGKAAGLYIEQKIIRTGKLEDLTAEELEQRMKQVMEEYSPILDGVEIQEVKEKVLEKPRRVPKADLN